MSDVRTIYFPYCLQKQDDGSWVILNRKYKPVGLNVGGWVNYEDYPVSMKIKGLGSATLKKLSWDGDIKKDTVYLYNDGSVPTNSSKHMKSYLDKLAILLKLREEIK